MLNKWIESYLQRQGFMLHFSMGGETPTADPAIGQAALKNTELSQQALDWFKQQAADQKPFQDSLNKSSLAAANAQTGLMGLQTQAAKDAIARQQNVAQPLQDQIINAAKNYDTPAAEEAAAGRAGGDVTQGFSNARAQQGRSMARMGINPNDGAWAAGDRQLVNAEALGTAGAENKARIDTRNIGAAKMQDAASMLSGLPGNATAAATAASGIGNGSVNSAMAPITAGNQIASTLGAGYGIAGGLNTSAGQLLTNVYNSQVAGANQSNAAMSGLGSAVGTVAGMYFGGPAGAMAGSRIGSSLGR